MRQVAHCGSFFRRCHPEVSVEKEVRMQISHPAKNESSGGRRLSDF